jgi:pimeloyl-ACP methyl ester carboxylesterase
MGGAESALNHAPIQRHRRAWLAVVAALAVLTPATPGYASTSSSESEIAWGACPAPLQPVRRDPREQCAALTVPLDYHRPDGPQISVEISRIPAADAALRHGILLLNSGGPGGPGLDLASQLAPLLPSAVLDRFDLIGFDQRGVGYSTPVTCAIDAHTAIDLTVPYPAPDGSIDRNVAYARDTARNCATQSGDLLPFITTANRARDMDRIRQAMGEPTLSYLGYSYGTYLGAVFTALFPERSDRIIVDSAIDPKLIWYNVFRTWGPAVALRLPDFTHWAAGHDATYHLGATAAAVTRTYYALAAKFDDVPLTLPNGMVVNGNIFREITRTALHNDVNFPSLAQTWQALATASSPPAHAFAAPPDLRARAGQTMAAVPADNSTAAQYAVVCDDVSWPRRIDDYARNTTLSRRLFPATSGMPANVWPCAYWANRPAEPPVTVTDRGPRNVLILQNLRDPVTPWTSGLALRESLGHRAAFVSVDQGGHGVYLLTQSKCANDIATAFLVGGTLPGDDRLCAGQAPPPVPGRADDAVSDAARPARIGPWAGSPCPWRDRPGRRPR